MSNIFFVICYELTFLHARIAFSSARRLRHFYPVLAQKPIAEEWRCISVQAFIKHFALLVRLSSIGDVATFLRCQVISGMLKSPTTYNQRNRIVCLIPQMVHHFLKSCIIFWWPVANRYCHAQLVQGPYSRRRRNLSFTYATQRRKLHIFRFRLTA